MPVELENRKCWLKDAEGLAYKSYLSNTRILLKDGLWIREFFNYFFPRTVTDPEGETYYDLGSLVPSCSVEEGYDVSEAKIPAEQMVKLFSSIEALENHISGKTLNFNERISLESFTLPSPDKHPELYQIVNDEGHPRLIVLWGLESELAEGNLTIREVYALLEKKFSFGKIQPPSKATESDVLEKGNTSKTTSSGFNLIKKIVSFLRNPTTIIVGIAIFLIAVPLYIRSQWKAEVSASASDSLIPSSSIILSENRNFVLPNHSKIEALSERQQLTVFPVLKPGNYNVWNPENDTLKVASQWKIPGQLSDTATTPSASILVYPKRGETGTTFVANVASSVTEDEESPIVKRAISWGDRGGEFEWIQETDEVLKHRFEKEGVYSVTLLVEDSSGKWAVDQETIHVGQADNRSSPSKPIITYRPALYAVRETGEYYEVWIDLSKCIDWRGTIESLYIDWGDDSEPDQVNYGTGYVRHNYPLSTRKARIMIGSETDRNRINGSASILALEFQSSAMNRLLSEKSDTELPATFESSRHQGEDTLPFVIEARAHSNLVRFMRPYQFLLIPKDLEKSFQPFYDIRWKLTSDRKQISEVENTFQTDMVLKEGFYTVEVSAYDQENHHHTLAFDLEVKISDQLSFIQKIIKLISEFSSK
ncbi:MAG: PKD domain-containing protein [Opitutales bacterium]|nr:PKD domain-containing protein [Opitutales bacterium]